MSKDPFEELFGPAADEPMPQTRPMPARQRLAQEQEVRVRASQPAAAGPARAERSGSAKPWIVVGIIAVLAIVASIAVVTIARGGGQDPDSSATAPATSEPAPETTQPDTTPDPEETPSEEPEEDQVPKVDVGPRPEKLDIDQWGVTSQLSSKFGVTQYRIENNNSELWLDSALIRQLPCEGKWGAVRTEAGEFEVLKPAERCAAAPELYDELWGLTDAWVKTIK